MIVSCLYRISFRPPKTNFNLKIMIARRLYSVLSWPRKCVWTHGPDFSSLIFGGDDMIILHRQVVQCPLPLLIPSDYMNQKLCWPRPRLANEAAPSHLRRTHLIPGKLKILRKYHLLNSIAWYWTCKIMMAACLAIIVKALPHYVCLVCIFKSPS